MSKKIIKKSVKKVPKATLGPVSPLRISNAVFIRTVTGYYTGRVEGINEQEILLSDAAWVADTGRWNEALVRGTLREVEPYPDGIISIGRGSVVDICSWKHALPRSVR